MTDASQNDDQPAPTSPDPSDAAGETAGHRRPDQGGAPAGKAEAEHATGADGAQGAGGPAGFGTGT